MNKPQCVVDLSIFANPENSADDICGFIDGLRGEMNIIYADTNLRFEEQCKADQLIPQDTVAVDWVPHSFKNSGLIDVVISDRENKPFICAIRLTGNNHLVQQGEHGAERLLMTYNDFRDASIEANITSDYKLAAYVNENDITTAASETLKNLFEDKATQAFQGLQKNESERSQFMANRSISDLFFAMCAGDKEEIQARAQKITHYAEKRPLFGQQVIHAVQGFVPETLKR